PLDTTDRLCRAGLLAGRLFTMETYMRYRKSISRKIDKLDTGFKGDKLSFLQC
ncbi:hypothetical protein HKBW3S42_01439, partial [Candidatus Hakubella thermalkaliphila]